MDLFARSSRSSSAFPFLCIDDQWNGLLGRKLLLEENGYKVLETTSRDEGLKLFLSHSVDAVVADYQMPGMNGDVVAAKMKRVKSHVPIMLLPPTRANSRPWIPSYPNPDHRRFF